MAIYLSADLHIFHNNVIRYCGRPFQSVEEMNEKLVLYWNEIVHPGDTVYCLGDISMAIRPIETFSSRLMGNKFLVSGNHDWTHSYHKKSNTPEKMAKWIAKYESHGWKVLPEQTMLTLKNGLEVNLCHLPYEFNHPSDDKYAKWRPVDDGKVLLHGHVHEKGFVSFSKKGSMMINVGVDVWNYRPVSEDQIIELIEQKRKENV